MDGLSLLNEALKLRWDTPYRFAGSVAAICALVGLVLHQSALRALAGLLGWLGWRAGADGLREAHSWLIQRADVFTWLGIVLIVAGILFAHRGGRGAATAMLGAALCSESGSFAPLWLLGMCVILWLVSRIIYWRFFNDVFSPFMQNFTLTFEELGASLVYAVAGPLKWAVFR